MFVFDVETLNKFSFCRDMSDMSWSIYIAYYLPAIYFLVMFIYIWIVCVSLPLMRFTCLVSIIFTEAQHTPKHLENKSFFFV